MRIIDRDIESWTAFAECHIDALSRCTPDQEEKHRAFRAAAEDVLDQLKKYRALVEKYSKN